MKTAILTLCEQGAVLARHLAERMDKATVFLHEQVSAQPGEQPFARVIQQAEALQGEYANWLFIMPTGVAVRAIAPWVKHKLQDPAVVVVDVAGRWAISLLSGHEGGANDLAMAVANMIEAEPIITTTTEAVRRWIVGIGCRKGTAAKNIQAAITDALTRIGGTLDDVRLLATADVKQNEPGLLAAATLLARPLKIISSREIKNTTRKFTRSEFVESKVNLPAVAEPSALLAGRRTELLLPKTIYPNVTIAIAQEHCMWSE